MHSPRVKDGFLVHGDRYSSTSFPDEIDSIFAFNAITFTRMHNIYRAKGGDRHFEEVSLEGKGTLILLRSCNQRSF